MAGVYQSAQVRLQESQREGEINRQGKINMCSINGLSHLKKQSVFLWLISCVEWITSGFVEVRYSEDNFV